MLRVHLARLMGVTSPDELKRSRTVVAWIVLLLFAVVLCRIITIVWGVVRAREWPELRRAAFGWYLLAVGCLAALVYAGARPVRLEYTRYGLLVLFIPIGLLAAGGGCVESLPRRPCCGRSCRRFGAHPRAAVRPRREDREVVRVRRPNTLTAALAVPFRTTRMAIRRVR